MFWLLAFREALVSVGELVKKGQSLGTIAAEIEEREKAFSAKHELRPETHRTNIPDNVQWSVCFICLVFVFYCFVFFLLLLLLLLLPVWCDAYNSYTAVQPYESTDHYLPDLVIGGEFLSHPHLQIILIDRVVL